MYVCTIVSRKYAPPYATLASVQNAGGGGGGGVYAGCEYFSRDYNPQPPLPVKHDLIVGGGGGGGQRRGREMLLSPDATGTLTTFNVEGRGSRELPRSSWRVHR